MSSISPSVITDMLSSSERQLADFLTGIPKEGVASVPVHWATIDETPIWLDTAREFTERWHHQQQIRDAVGVESIAIPRYLRPVLATLILAVPFGYRAVPADAGEIVRIQINGESGNTWDMRRESNRWTIQPGGGEIEPIATVILSEDTAWRFLTRSINADSAETRITFIGDQRLARHFIQIVAVMAPGN